MTKLLRAFGFTPDLQGQYDSHHELMRSSKAIIAAPDHYSYRSGYTYQNGYGLCVIEAIRRSIQLKFAILGLNSEFLISDIAGYVMSLASQYMNANPGCMPEDIPKLEDIGLRPYFALLALQDMGVLDQVWMPGPASGDSFDARQIFMAPKDFPNNLLVYAFKLRGLTFKQVDYGTYEQFCTAIDTLMVQGNPIMWALHGDSITEVSDEIIASLPDTGQNHYVSLLSFSDKKKCRSDNWWRRDEIRYGLEDLDTWGQPDGTWLHTAEAIYEGASNVLTLTWTPTP